MDSCYLMDAELLFGMLEALEMESGGDHTMEICLMSMNATLISITF
jgi:hypothetical protein